MGSWSYGGVQTSFNGISHYLSKKEVIPKGLDINQTVQFIGKVLRDFLKHKEVTFDKRKNFAAIDKNAKKTQKYFSEFSLYIETLKNGN